MANKLEEIVLTPEQQEQLDEIIEMYFEASEEEKSAKAKKDALNLTLKELLKDFGISKYTSNNGYNVSVSTRSNISFDEDMLLAFCKTKNVEGLIKTKEYVDMEELESSIYHGNILKEELKPCQIVKPDVVTLRVSQRKQLNG